VKNHQTLQAHQKLNPSQLPPQKRPNRQVHRSLHHPFLKQLQKQPTVEHGNLGVIGCSLPGIGESKAKVILTYRQEKGSFTKIEKLLEIKGIGEKMLAALKSLIYIGPH
jgi:competence ComEA-like helix-hairpin-helix protein